MKVLFNVFLVIYTLFVYVIASSQVFGWEVLWVAGVWALFLITYHHLIEVLEDEEYLAKLTIEKVKLEKQIEDLQKDYKRLEKTNEIVRLKLQMLKGINKNEY